MPVDAHELAHTLRYQKFVQRIGRFGTTPVALVAQYSALVTLVSPTQVPRVIERDRPDSQRKPVEIPQLPARKARKFII